MSELRKRRAEEQADTAWLGRSRRVTSTEDVNNYSTPPAPFSIGLTRYAALSEDLGQVYRLWYSPVADLRIVDQDDTVREIPVDLAYLTKLRSLIDKALPYLEYATQHEPDGRYDRPYEPLLVETEVGTYYVGPLEPAKRLVAQDRFVKEEIRDGVHVVLLGDTEEPDEAAEFGSWGEAEGEEKAWRYALGAYFGPMDDGYDDLRLRVLLAQHEGEGQ